MSKQKDIRVETPAEGYELRTGSGFLYRKVDKKKIQFSCSSGHYKEKTL